MTASLETLIHSLRDELQQYGEMLALLDQQQEGVLARAADEVLHSVSAIHAQGSVIESARRAREIYRREVAIALGLPKDAAFVDLLPRLPEEYRPLVQALVEENNELLVRVQQRARQNHLLLSRSLELMQKFLSSLFPPGRSQTYDGAGKMYAPALPMHSLYEAVV